MEMSKDKDSSRFNQTCENLPIQSIKLSKLFLFMSLPKHIYKHTLHFVYINLIYFFLFFGYFSNFI